MRKRLRIGLLTAVCVFSWGGFMGLLASAPAAAASSTLTWSAPLSVLSVSFNGVSCASNTQCVVVGASGKAVTSTDPAGGASAWTAAHVDSSNVMNAISCPSTSLCVAVDSAGNVVTSTNPTGGGSAWTATNVDGSNSVTGVSCHGTSLCVAVDNAGNVISSTNPTGGASAWTVTNVDGSNTVDGVSCPSTSLCVAVDSAGDVVTSTNPTGAASAWTVTHVDGSYTVYSVSCPSTSLCVAGDSYGNVVTSTNPTGGATTWTVTRVDSTTFGGLQSISCPSANFCVAGDQQGDVVTSTNPTGGASAWTLTSVDSGFNTMNSTSCPSTSLCVVVDNVGNVVIGESQVSGVSFAASSAAPGASSTWTVGFTTSANGALTSSTSTITLTGPSGTVFPATASDYKVNGTTVTAIVSGGTNTASFVVPASISISTSVTVTASNVTNPSVGNDPASDFSVSTSSDLISVNPTTGIDFAYAADGSGTMTVSPTFVQEASTGNALIFTYTAASGGMSNGEVAVTVPGNWTVPSTTSGPGYTTASTGTVALSSTQIQVTGVTLAGGNSMTITYGSGGNVTAPTGGTSLFSAREKSTSTGTLTALSATPSVSLVAPDGGGSLSISQTDATAGTKNFLTFIYQTPSVGGMNDGEVTIAVPAGWSPPSTTSGTAGYASASAGTVTVSGSTIEVTGLTLGAGGSFSISYGGGTGAVATSTVGTSTFTAQEKSTSAGTLTAIGTSPALNIYPPNGSGTMTVSPANVAPGSTGNTFTFTYTAATGGMSDGDVEIDVPSLWSTPNVSIGSVGYTTASTGTMSVAAPTIEVTGVTLAGGATMTITYSDATAPGAGSYTFSASASSTNNGMGSLASSPGVVVAYAADGSGTMTVSPTSTSASSTGNTLSFTYTAAQDGISDGEVAIAVPSGWSAPGTTSGTAGYTTASTGTVGISGSVIDVTGVTLSAGSTLTVTYGEKTGGGSGATAQSTTGTSSFTAQEKSTSSGTLTTLASSPSLTIGNALAMTTSNLPGGTYGSSYSATLSAGGGRTPYTWTATGLPGGLSLTVSGSVYSITGTPTAAGSASVTLKVTDATGTSVSNTLPLVVAKASTTTTVSANPNPASPGESVTYTATVGGNGNPTGTVDFEDGGSAIAGCSSRTIGSGTATCAVSYTSSGNHSITAVYSGDSNSLSSTSTALSQAVSNPVNSVLLAATPGSLPVNGSGTVQGTVYGASGTVANAQVTLRLSRGDSGTAGTLGSSSLTTDSSGTFSTGFSAPPDSGTVTVTASVYGSVYTGQTVVIITPEAVTVEGTNTAESTGGCNTATATVGYTTETGCGTGTFAVAQYGTSNPASTTAVSGVQEYFDAAVSTGNILTSSTIEECNAQSGDVLEWWNTTASVWQDVYPAATLSGSCLTFTANASSTPSLSHLYGTVFVLVAPQTLLSSGGGGGVAVTGPEITGITPPSGPESGGTTVTITGSGFTGATAVDFGRTPAQGFSVRWDREILAVSPAGSGTVDITVVTPSGTTATGSVDQFTYTTDGTMPPVAFSDVPPSFWAYNAIENLARGRIVDGFPNGTFQPNADVTRAQFVKMLALTLGIPSGSGSTPFSDVDPHSWYGPYVSAAYGAGIVKGVSPTEFDPNGTVTREQMALLLTRALKLTGSQTLSFTDAPSVNSWALSGVEAAVSAGYLNGFPNGSFQPEGPTTRAQAAKVLALVLRKQS